MIYLLSISWNTKSVVHMNKNSDDEELSDEEVEEEDWFEGITCRADVDFSEEVHTTCRHFKPGILCEFLLALLHRRGMAVVSQSDQFVRLTEKGTNGKFGLAQSMR